MNKNKPKMRVNTKAKGNNRSYCLWRKSVRGLPPYGYSVGCFRMVRWHHILLVRVCKYTNIHQTTRK